MVAVKSICQTSQRGFTLVELIMVIVIMGVVGGMVSVFMKGPIDAYISGGRRAALTDTADTAVRRMDAAANGEVVGVPVLPADRQVRDDRRRHIRRHHRSAERRRPRRRPVGERADDRRRTASCGQRAECRDDNGRRQSITSTAGIRAVSA